MKGNKMRLEYKNQYENAFKFWEIKIESKNKVITKYGRIGIQNPAKTENFSAVSEQGYFVDTSGQAITVTLPATPSLGDQIQITDFNKTFHNQPSKN